jgi:hypothetical protein
MGGAEVGVGVSGSSSQSKASSVSDWWSVP